MRRADRRAGRRHPRRPAAQRGAATLLTTVVLVFSISLMTVHAARVAVTEQRLVSNDQRAQEALAAAQAGVAAVIETLPPRVLEGLRFDARGIARLPGPSDTLPGGARFTTAVETLAATPYRAELLAVRSRGRSGDGATTRTVHRHLAFTPWLARLPTGALAVRPPGRPRPGREAFFSSLLGRPPATLRAPAARVSCVRCAGAQLDAGGRLLWADASPGLVLTGGTIGRPDRPVILVIEGDLSVARETRVFGLVYVDGDLQAGAGRLFVQGAMGVAGRIGARPAVTHRPELLDRLARLGRYAPLAGSWRDF